MTDTADKIQEIIQGVDTKETDIPNKLTEQSEESETEKVDTPDTQEPKGEEPKVDNAVEEVEPDTSNEEPKDTEDKDEPNNEEPDEATEKPDKEESEEGEPNGEESKAGTVEPPKEESPENKPGEQDLDAAIQLYRTLNEEDKKSFDLELIFTAADNRLDELHILEHQLNEKVKAFEKAQLTKEVTDLVNENELQPSMVNLLVDLGDLDKIKAQVEILAQDSKERDRKILQGTSRKATPLESTKQNSREEYNDIRSIIKRAKNRNR